MDNVYDDSDPSSEWDPSSEDEEREDKVREDIH